MNYSVLNDLANERKMKTNDPAMVLNNNEQEVGSTRHFNEKKSRRFRCAITTEQIKYLEKEFQKFPYIESGSRKAVASILNIPERTVKFWFQNRRMREKKDAVNKEVEEDKKRLSTNLDAHLDREAHSTQGKSILICPEFKKDTANNIDRNRNHCSSKELCKSTQEKQRIAVRSFDNVKMFETPRHINEATTEMNTYHNMCVPKAMAMKQNPKNLRAKASNPKDNKFNPSTSSRNCQPYYYPIHPNDQSYMPVHIQSLQPPAPSNIIWKPVNMVTLVPRPPPPQVIHERYMPMNQNLAKERCRCSCKIYNQEPSYMTYELPNIPPGCMVSMNCNNNFE